MAFHSLFNDFQELRQKNFATVQAYISRRGDERIDRWTMYHPAMRPMLDFSTSRVVEHYRLEDMLENQKRMEAMNVKGFADWHFYDNTFFECADPHKFIVQGLGRGVDVRYKNQEHDHLDHYIHTFYLHDGKIIHYSEVGNPMHEVHEFGIRPRVPDFPAFEALFEKTEEHDPPYRAKPCDDPALRRKNVEIVMNYLSAPGPDRAERWKLFAKDCSYGINQLPDDLLRRAYGIDAVRRVQEGLTQCFPNWIYRNLDFYFCQDPNYIIVRTDGDGVCVGCADRPFKHDDQPFHSFYLEDGKIRDYRLLVSPMKFCQDMGWDFGFVFGDYGTPNDLGL